MKKFTAVIVIMVLLCSFVTIDIAYKLCSFVALDIAYNVTDEDKISEIVLTNDTYEEAIQMFLDYMNNHDAEGIMKMSYPDKYVDTAYFLMEYYDLTIEERMNNLEKELPETVSLTDIIFKQTLDDDDMEDFYEDYAAFQLISDYIEETGKENIDPDKAFDVESFPKPYCKINDFCIVNCLLEYENKNGGTLTAEQPFLMLEIDGEGWKTFIDMMDIVKEAKQKTIDIISDTLKEYSDAVLADLDEMGVEIPEKCTICSDSSKNYNVSDEFLSSFMEALLYYNPDYKELGYIIEIDNGCCVNAECTEAFIKTPSDNSSSEYREHIIMFGEYTLEDIHNLCVEEIQKVIIKMKEVKKLW